MKKSITTISLVLAMLAPSATAMAAEATSLNELLQQVRRAASTESAERQRREQEFRQARDQQRQLLAQARAEEQRQEQRSARLKTQFDDNERQLTEMTETLRARMGNLGELFGVVRQMAGDIKTVIDQSLVSAQVQGRGETISRLSQSRALPSIEELQQLWLIFQTEMTEQSMVSKFESRVVQPDGSAFDGEVVRVGVFNAIHEDNFLTYIPETSTLQVLDPQPKDRFRSVAGDLYDAADGYVTMAIDPSRGQLLSVLVLEPDWKEQISFGGTIGYIILVIGGIGLLLAAVRIFYLGVAGGKIKGQLKSSTPSPGNALGRIMAVYRENQDDDVETLELKLDEAILKETPNLEAGQSWLKIFAAVAPLLGLLGTVTGMINVFTKITLFGTGDAKLMAEGISQALVTTQLGLWVAIPMVVLHAIISTWSKSLIEILEEQSAGIIAAQSERG